MAEQDGTAEAAAIETSLRGLGTPQGAVSEKAYLKSDLEFTGTPVPAVRATIRAWRRSRPDLTHAELIAVTKPLPPEVAARLLAARAGQRGRGKPR